jgi:glycolate oxidase iron-sulfur subunit
MLEVKKNPKSTWLDESELYKCVHCGFCLQACPTYLATGLETESPRGRIALMKAVNEGRLEISNQVIRHWDLCVQCRACEDVCPSGVPYGNLIESTMDYVRDYRRIGLLPRLAYEIALKYLLPNQKNLSVLVAMMDFYIKSGFQKLVRKTKILRLISKRLENLEMMTPTLNGEFFRADDHVYRSGIADAEKIQMLTGCVMPLTQGNQMRAAVRVLNKAGKDVEVPSSQVCCGAINSHVGDVAKAKELARENIEAFSKGNIAGAIVVASAGCGARMKEYGPLLADDPEYSSKAANFSKRVVDINEYLDGTQLQPGEFGVPRVVTYQDSCHLANVQKVRDAPRNLLKSIQGIDFSELKESNICCGAGGTYMITEPEMSKGILANKMKNIVDSGVDTIATANPGCFMQLQNGIREEGLDVEVKYVTDLLDETYTKK